MTASKSPDPLARVFSIGNTGYYALLIGDKAIMECRGSKEAVEDLWEKAMIINDAVSGAVSTTTRERATDIIREWLHTPTLLLRSGEMSDQEIRTVKAVLAGILAQVKGSMPEMVHGEGATT